MVRFPRHRIRQSESKTLALDEGSISQNNKADMLSSQLEQNLAALRNILGSSNDIIIREFSLGYDHSIHGAIIFLDGLVDIVTINDNLMKSLMYDTYLIPHQDTTDLSDISAVKKNLISIGDVQQTSLLNDVVDKIMAGNTLLFIDNSSEALVISTKKWEKRSVEEPQTETVVRGPREGFSETLRVNTSLLRRKIRNRNLCLENLTIGEQTKTDICIVYIKGLVNPKLIKEIRTRMQEISTDAILESGYIEAFIEDAPYSIFSTVGNSEKPDVVAAKILEGRAAILVDGTPFVLTVPMLFLESFQSAEDYYSRPFYSSFIRLIRFGAYLSSILAPASYVALSTFHQELIPTKLLFTMAAGREGVPFPAVAEALIMMLTFDILREAGVRLPRPVGSAVSIVGALVLGQAAVSAGLITPLMVIVVAFTAIASFVVPPQTDSASILRYALLVLAGIAGGFGILMGLLVTFIHLASLRSFGTPYMSPIAPVTLEDLKDTFIRMPLWAMFTRPRTIGWHNLKRQKAK